MECNITLAGPLLMMVNLFLFLKLRCSVPSQSQQETQNEDALSSLYDTVFVGKNAFIGRQFLFWIKVLLIGRIDLRGDDVVLPEGWLRFYDNSVGQWYYYNEVTQETKWTLD